MTQTHEKYEKRQAETGYHSTLCDVRGCNAIASHKTKINHVPHGIVTFHCCENHYDKHNGTTWESFSPFVKAYCEYKG